jgi:ribonuclease R
MKTLEGIIRISVKGIGYISTTPGNREESIEIDSAFLNTALHGDTVLVAIHPQVPGEQPTGEVKKILARKTTEFVGVLEAERGFFYLVPDDKRMYKDLLIAADKLAGAQAGDKVLARLTEWTDAKKDPIGEVVLKIGAPGEHETEMQAIVYSKGFKPGFPAAVEEEAAEIKKRAPADFAAELTKRRDCRSILTFTIDPADAKDFDDAISYQELPGGQIEIGVHIADVSHYLVPGTRLDAEARRRATSIYLVDRTIPMLPEVLSNDLCSLNEGEDKLVFSAIFTFDQKDNLVGTWIGRAVIRSAKRFTYESAEEVLKTGQGPHAAELKTINRIAHKLRKEKFAAGAIAFEQDEIKFVLDAAGRPVSVYKKVRGDSNWLIEDLMLLANRRVAEWVEEEAQKTGQDHPFIYRIHDQPDPEKLKRLIEFIGPLGYKLERQDDGKVTPAAINALIKQVQGQPEANLVETATLRSLAKAIYSLKNIGHYGLAFGHYTHFTSPIRRYPDVMVHRLLATYLANHKVSPDEKRDYEAMADHSSEMEVAAQEAERDSIKYKQAEYLATQIGQVFDGVISGLAKWGIYVQEQSTLSEGMIKLSEMKDDFYTLDEKRYAMVGQRSRKTWRLGDKVRVKLLRADPKERMIDFEFV